ncbi:MAG: M18 family aminopeptidase [Acidimicrobiales bacterium]
MAEQPQTTALAMTEFIDGAPSPFHAVQQVARRLESAGYREVAERDEWSGDTQQGFFRRGGSLVAWQLGNDPEAGYRIVGAHTDSPNLRVKPNPDTSSAGFVRLGVEVYGGVLLNSWLDRDLGLSGRVAVEEDGRIAEHLILVDEAVMRVPQLAIHLDREISDRGLRLNKQTHMSPVWALDDEDPKQFQDWLADRLGADPEAIRGWDLMAHDLTPGAILGADRSMVAAPRIDNLASCYAATEAIRSTPVQPHSVVICLFDHEEVGSTSATGAAGSLLPDAIGRIQRLLSDDQNSLPRALAMSSCISADGAHATHPNYVERHEPEHHIALNAGPVIKRNANERYATSAISQAIAEQACRNAGVPFQMFVNRTDLACGSTIGPVTAARLGIPTVDMGLAQLSMHSARELCGVEDPAHLCSALASYMASEPVRA